jgi:long-chain acyl-CoA synthetase
VSSSLDSAHEDIADAAAIGVPDDLLGETVGLFVQRRHPPRAGHPPLTRDTVRAHVRARWPQATPTWIWFLGDEGGDPAIPTAWPQTASGKIRKVELREVAGDLARRGIGRVTSA